MGSLRWLANESMSVLQLQLPRRRSISYASLFENNHYIRLLNQLLQLELGSIELYMSCQRELAEFKLENLAEGHRRQAKNLVNMIINNRGIPLKSGFAFSSELSLIASRIGRHLPSSVARRTCLTSCIQLEKAIRRRYHQALSEAPYRDRELLSEHIRRTKFNLDHLLEVRSAQKVRYS